MQVPELQSKANFGTPLAFQFFGASPTDFGSTTKLRFASKLFTTSAPFEVLPFTTRTRIVPGSITLLPTWKAKGTFAVSVLCAEATPAVAIRTAAAVVT